MFPLFVLTCLLWAGASEPKALTCKVEPAKKIFDSSTVRRLEELNEMKLKKLIQNRKGKALFINVWATWCEPCVEEFPDIVKLSNEFSGRNIDFVGVSGDDVDDETSKVLPFISREKAEFKFYIAKLEGEDDFIDAFDKRWGGGMPATFIYSPNGKPKVILVGKQSYQNLKNAIEKALAK
jgi:thiol-disulfide isomerase/thioredoxin